MILNTSNNLNRHRALYEDITTVTGEEYQQDQPQGTLAVVGTNQHQVRRRIRGGGGVGRFDAGDGEYYFLAGAIVIFIIVLIVAYCCCCQKSVHAFFHPQQGRRHRRRRRRHQHHPNAPKQNHDENTASDDGHHQNQMAQGDAKDFDDASTTESPTNTL